MSSMTTGSLNIRIRILDSERRLLFILNRQTRKLEIIPVRGGKAQGARRKKYFISVDTLNHLIGPMNILSDEPINEYVIEEEEDA